MGTKTGKELKLNAEIKTESAMDIEESAKIPQRYGLVNVGNTCYMNSAIQLLRSIPELNQIVRTFKITNVVLS
jgi:ubiquitin C-terminal hydrolase